MGDEPIAAIDIGTNTVLMLVARPGGEGGLVTLADAPIITRLGEGVDRTGRLTPRAIERTLAALREHVRLAQSLHASVVAVGTSALRDAANAEEFLRSARDILGVEVEVISGEREARLTFAGATEGLKLEGQTPTVVDIGGGSTELVRGSTASDAAERPAAASLQLGSVRLSERHGLRDRVDPDAMAQLRAEIEAALSACSVRPAAPLIGIAGTVTTLAAVAEGMARYEPTRLHGLQIEACVLTSWIERLAKLTIAQRTELPGMDPGRADVIVAGALILEGVLRASGADGVIVSTGGVRVGLCREAFTPRQH